VTAAEVLRARQTVRLLLASQVGRLPLASAPLALLLFARQMSIAMAGVLVGAYTAGTAVGQPLLARAADRWRQPPVLWAAVALSTAGFAVTALHPAPVVALGAAAAGVGAPPFEACLRVLWRDLIAERLLHTAYTMDVALQELIFIVGPLLALAGYGLGGARGGLVATAAAQLLGTALFATAPAVRHWRGDPAPRHWAGALRSAQLRLLLAATLLVGAAVGGTAVAVARYADAHGSRSLAGWLLAAQAAGALAGGVAAMWRPAGDPRRALPVLVGLQAAGYLPPLLAGPPALMALALAGSGFLLPAVLTSVFITVDQVAEPGTAAESFAWVATAFATGSATGSIADGALAQTADTALPGFLLAPLTIAVAAALLLLTRGWHQPGPTTQH
jgi:predicted MFS family arabinose efflux permease